MSGGKELVLDTLRRATSQDAATLKPAEQQLQEWETEPGFYSTLVEVSAVFIFAFSHILYSKRPITRELCSKGEKTIT